MKKLFLFLCIFSSIFVISCGTKKDNIEVRFKINNNESFDLENFVIYDFKIPSKEEDIYKLYIYLNQEKEEGIYKYELEVVIV